MAEWPWEVEGCVFSADLTLRPHKSESALENQTMVTYLEGCFWPTEQQA